MKSTYESRYNTHNAVHNTIHTIHSYLIRILVYSYNSRENGPAKNQLAQEIALLAIKQMYQQIIVEFV